MKLPMKLPLLSPIFVETFGETGELGKPNKKMRKWTYTFKPIFNLLLPSNHSQTNLVRLQQRFSIRIYYFKHSTNENSTFVALRTFE